MVNEDMETDPKYFWIDRLKADPVWGKYRLKDSIKGIIMNPEIDIHHDLIDVADFNVFVRIEEERLPLFIGPSFKIMINLRSVYLDYPKRRMIAILDDSLLSGSQRGLTIKEYFRSEEEPLAFSEMKK